jgi:hypothetical protein
MNDAMTNIVMGKNKRLNLWVNFSMGNSAPALKTGEVNQISYRGVENLMHLIRCTETELDI